MSFQGSLRELQLADIIQLVSTSGKTGKFFLTRDDEQGSLYLKQGRIVHAEVGDLEGEEAVHVLASWNSGDFRFEPSVEIDRVSIHKSNTQLLMEAAHQHDEWRVLSRKVPGLDSVPTLASADAGRPVTLSPAEWGLIVRIDGKKSVRELAKEAESSSFDVAKLLYGLVTANLVEMLPPTREATPSSAGDERRVLEILCTRIRQEAELGLGAALVAVAVAWFEVSPAPDAVALLVTEPALRSAWLMV